jgi:hypothetical protein
MTQELFECNNIDEVKSVVLDHAKDNPDLPFVMGVGWRYDYIPGGLPNKELLDTILDCSATIGTPHRRQQNSPLEG